MSPISNAFPGKWERRFQARSWTTRAGTDTNWPGPTALEERYRGKTGRDIRLWMPLLIDEDAEGRFVRARHDWFDSVSDIYAGYFRGISDRLAERGLTCTGHLWEENLMWQASAVGDYFKAMRSFSLPGADALGLNVLDVRDFKEAQSVASFESRGIHGRDHGRRGLVGIQPRDAQAGGQCGRGTGREPRGQPTGFSRRANSTPIPGCPTGSTSIPCSPISTCGPISCAARPGSIRHGRPAADVLVLNPMEQRLGAVRPGRFRSGVQGPRAGSRDFPRPSAGRSGTRTRGNETAVRLVDSALMQTWYDERVPCDRQRLLEGDARPDPEPHRIPDRG